MPTISFGMMFYNEAGCIEKCIKSFAPLCDEFIAVDMGGNDGSIDIVKGYTSNIYSNTLRNDFGAARNFLKSKCTKEWCLLVDPDEFILEEQVEDFKKLVSLLDSSQYDAVRLPRINWADREQTTQMAITGTKDYQFKLFKNAYYIKYVNKVHEVLRGCKNILDYPHLMTHHNQFWKTEERRVHQNQLYETIR